MEVDQEMFTPPEVTFADVVVLQSFLLRDGSVTKVFLKPDFRGVN